MILDDAVKLLHDLGARKVPGKELKNLHGIYAYMMVLEELKTINFGERKTLSTDKQRFIAAGVYQEDGKILIEKTVWTIANVEAIPVIIVIYGYFEPQMYLYHPDEVLTKHRDDRKSMFGVVGIEFSLKLGEKIESLEGLRKKWLKTIESWTEREKSYSSKQIQKKMKGYLESKTSIGSSTQSRTLF